MTIVGTSYTDDELPDLASGDSRPATLDSAGAAIELLGRRTLALQSALGVICVTFELLDEDLSAAELSKALNVCARLASAALGRGVQVSAAGRDDVACADVP